MASNAGRMFAGGLLVAGGVIGVVGGAETYGEAEASRGNDTNVISGAWHVLEDSLDITKNFAHNWLEAAGFSPDISSTEIPGGAYQGIGELALWGTVTVAGGYMFVSGYKRSRNH